MWLESLRVQRRGAKDGDLSRFGADVGKAYISILSRGGREPEHPDYAGCHLLAYNLLDALARIPRVIGGIMRRRTFTLVLAWLSLMIMAGSAGAVPITSSTVLVQDVTRFGQVSGPPFSGNDAFFTFSGTAGQSITLTVNRLDAGLDPFLALYQGSGLDTDDLFFLTAEDDNIPEFPGLEGPHADPQLMNFILPATSVYTVAVMSLASNGDGPFDFQITLGTPPQGPVTPSSDVPEPMALALLGLGLAGLGLARRRRAV